MADVSPIRWHLAHTTWFFETFILSRDPNYQPAKDSYAYLFNSYYNALGDQFPRERRGLLSRPTVEEVWGYRQQIDERMLDESRGVKILTARWRQSWNSDSIMSNNIRS